MKMPDQAEKSIIKKISNGYWFMASILINSLIIFIILNCLFFILFKINSRFNLFSTNIIFQKYNKVNFEFLYSNMSLTEINNLLRETWSRTYMYEPFTQFKESPCQGHYVNVDKNGFRKTKNQGSWPPQPKSINIFLFGGSTTFGYGVSDNQTIASYLQEYLNEKLGTDVRVYNFGRGYYYLTQERLLFEQLLKSGLNPDFAIFIDGLNDFSFSNDEPFFTDRLRQIFSPSPVESVKSFIFSTSLGRAAEIIQVKLASLFQKKEFNKSNPPSKGEIANSYRVGSAIADHIINRYLFDKKLVEAASTISGVKSVFILQPNPFYNYDKKYYPFSEGTNEALFNLKHSYERLANVIKENPMGDNFIWCADIQKDLKQPLYIDQVHYSPGFSKIFAEVIGDQLLARFNLNKRSDPVTANHNR